MIFSRYSVYLYDERLGVRKHKILSSLLPPLLFLLMAPITQTSPVPDLVCLSTFSGNFNQLCGEERFPVLEQFLAPEHQIHFEKVKS